LRAKGLRTGRYTSPHLVDFRERILIDGRPVAEDEVVDFIARWTPVVERLGATFFEATTAMAFDILARARVDVAIVETGLGGRLDSTNVVRPIVAGVTSIGLDHTEYLGDSLEAIAAEKAGIFKPGAAAVIGAEDPSIQALLAGLARERGASEVRVLGEGCTISGIEVGAEGTRFTLECGELSGPFLTPLRGAHQARNAALSLLMLDAAGEPYRVTRAEAAAALMHVRLPGRFQRLGKFIFDVAHNPDGARVLVRTVREVRPARPLVVLLTVLVDKDWRGMMRELSAVADHFVLTTSPSAPASRSWHADEALAFARENGWSAERNDDFTAALELAERLGETVLVTGSFHTVGDAMTRLQVDPLAG
jgi:dihydrofolate synthase/folylpolyglutamate synthase